MGSLTNLYNTTQHITTKMSTKVFLLAQSQEVEVEEMDLSLPTLADLGLTKAALLESLAGLSNTTALFERLGDFFDFQNAGQTQLGKVMAWKGDLIQPVIMFALGAIIIYSTVELILVLLGGLLFQADCIRTCYEARPGSTRSVH